MPSFAQRSGVVQHQLNKHARNSGDPACASQRILKTIPQPYCSIITIGRLIKSMKVTHEMSHLGRHGSTRRLRSISALPPRRLFSSVWQHNPNWHHMMACHWRFLTPRTREQTASAFCTIFLTDEQTDESTPFYMHGSCDMHQQLSICTVSLHVNVLTSTQALQCRAFPLVSLPTQIGGSRAIAPNVVFTTLLLTET